MYRKWIHLIAALAILVGMIAFPFAPPAIAQSEVTAADLRALLTAQLGEHVLLAGAATNAALHGNMEEFEVAAQAVDENSQDIAAAIGLVYGDAAGNAFLPLWRSHIDMFVDYAFGVGTGDSARAQQAVDDLNDYRDDFGAFLASANPNLTREVVSESLIPHVQHLAAMVNAQATGDYETAYRELRTAFEHSADLGLVLAWAIAEQFPERFPGQADAPEAGLQILLSQQLAEHTFLAAMATNAALQGFNADFEAAADALDQNSIDLSASIAAVYGDGAGNAFLPLWRAHIGMFVDYTIGVATNDQAMQDQAVSELDEYRDDFGAFLASANPNLTRQMVADALIPHVMGLATVVNSQATGDYATAYRELRMAYYHADELGAILAGAIAAQFPSQFMAESMPHHMPATGHAPGHTGHGSGAGQEGLGAYAMGIAGVLMVFGGLIYFLRRRGNATEQIHAASKHD